MTITFCLIPSIPSGVLREHSGLNHFLYFSILNYENKLDTCILKKVVPWRLVWDIESEGSCGGM